MNLTLFDARPEESSVTPAENRCYDLLDSLGISFQRVDHEAADTIEICHPIEKTLGCDICKNLFLANRQQTVFYLLLLPGDKPFKTKYLSAQIQSSRLSFGSPENMERLMDLKPGSVSVFGLMNDKENKISLLIDRDLEKEEYIGFHPCKNTSTLKVKYHDITTKFLPAVNHEPAYVELPWTFDD